MPIKIFFCYAHEDEALRNELEKQLRILQRQGLIVSWHDRDIHAGEEWINEIDMHLETAQIILLLVSSDFMDSDYCYGVEMKRALERHIAGEARVIPIILRPVHWKDAPFSKLQVLPTDGKPVVNWVNRDEAFLHITSAIRIVVKELLASYKTSEGDALYQEKRYDEALSVYKQAIQLDPNYVTAYIGKGNALSALKRYKEAFSVYEEAIQLDPDLASAYIGKNRIFEQLEKSIEVQRQLETELLNAKQQLKAKQLEAQQELKVYHERTQQLERQLAIMQSRTQQLAVFYDIEQHLNASHSRNQHLETELLDTQQQLEAQRFQVKQRETQLLNYRSEIDTLRAKIHLLEIQNTVLLRANEIVQP